MLARSIPARALLHSRLSPAGAASVRRLSVAPRLSAIALGKRPALPPRVGGIAAIGASRGISFISGKAGAPGATTVDASTAASASTVTTPAEAVSSTTTSAVNTPLPSSDIPATPAEHTLPAPDHLTSTAPDHLFHSDPTPLLPQSPANAQTPTLEDLITNSGLPLEQVLNSPEAVHAAMQSSDLKLMGLEHSVINLSGWMRDALVGLHQLTGLPWWVTIMLMTVMMRSCLFPLVLRNLKHSLRFQAVSEQFNSLLKRVSEAGKSGDKLVAATAQQNLQTLMKTHNVNPLTPMVMPLASIPLFLSMFYAVRKLAELPLPQLKEGGFSWVLDLTMADPYYILPCTSVLLQLAAFKLGVDGTGGQNKAKQARTMGHMHNVFIVLSPAIAYVVSSFPAAVLFYWTSANTFTLIQAFLLRQHWVRRLLGVVEPPKIAAPLARDLDDVDPNPSIMDTWRAAKDTHNTMYAKAKAASELKAELRAREQLERERDQSARRGTALLAERVQEPKAGSKVMSFLEAEREGKAGKGEVKSEGQVVVKQGAGAVASALSHAERKKRRLMAEARKREMRQEARR